MKRNLAAGLVAAAVVTGGLGGWAYAASNHHHSTAIPPAPLPTSSSSASAPASTIPTASPTANTSPTASTSPTGPVLAWDSYDGVTIGESMAAAAAHLGGKVATNLTYKIGGVVAPKPAQCGSSGQELITGITPGVHIVSDAGGPNAVVNWISFDRGVGVGPLGIASGMTLAQAQSVSGRTLTGTVNPSTGATQYELPHGSLTFAFLADPLVRNLTLVSTAELRAGGIFDGGVTC